jgi:hypothetical protein
MSKKILSVFLVFALSLTFLSGFSHAKDFDVVTGKTYLSLPEKSFDGPTEQSKLTVRNFVVNNSNFNLIGQVTYSGKTYPINLEGTLHEDLMYKEGVSGTLKDKTGVFGK